MGVTPQPEPRGAYGLGFAGVGWLGESLIRELPKVPGLRLVAVQDASADLAADVASRYASPWQGTAYEALLAAPGVDAVVICTPNALHAAQARAALRAGKHVLVQKPLAVDPADARSTQALARAVGRVLFVDYSYRFLETTRALGTAVGGLGQIKAVQGVFANVYGPGKPWFFDPRLSGGGALVDLGVHLLDLAIELVRPGAVRLESADLAFGGGHPVEDAARLRVWLDDVPLDLAVSWNADRPASEIGLEVRCASGMARWENVEGSFFRFRTWRDGVCLLERETTLREDTLVAFQRALADPSAAATATVELRVYDLLAQAYARAPWRAGPPTV